MDIGQVITQLRKKKKMSQSELSHLTGITQASLSHIESGNKKPHRKNLERICEVLDIPIKMFYLLTITVDDLPENSRDKFNSIEKDLKQLIFDTF